MKLLRAIRFDDTDTRVFDVAASADEWAIPGGFAFMHLKEREVSGKTRQAFANGFLGLNSFGYSTFATVAIAEQSDVAMAEQKLAVHFVDRYGAPDVETALPTARDELAFVISLCEDVPINTVFTLRRHFDKRGEIREEFRKIAAPGGEPMHTKIWSVVEDDP